MAYINDLGSGRSLYIDHQGTHTMLTLSSSSLGQQQSQSCSIATGNWTAPPTLFQTPMGLVLRVESSQGQIFIAVQGTQVQVLATPPVLTDAEVLPLRRTESVATSAMPPMSPMSPMQPMRMGNMEMQMQPMRMRMGDMELQMGVEQPTQPSPSKRFCPQCGGTIKASDHFCSHCGQALS